MHDGGDGYTHFALSTLFAFTQTVPEEVSQLTSDWYGPSRQRFPHRKMDLAANTTVVRAPLERSVIRVYSIKQNDTTVVSHRDLPVSDNPPRYHLM